MVARVVRDDEVAGSNPVIPTIVDNMPLALAGGVLLQVISAVNFINNILFAVKKYGIII